VRPRTDWKFLPGPELDGPGFGFAVPGGFRSRLVRREMEEKAPAAVLTVSGSPCRMPAASRA
jgi:hypothetical protein